MVRRIKAGKKRISKLMTGRRSRERREVRPMRKQEKSQASVEYTCVCGTRYQRPWFVTPRKDTLTRGGSLRQGLNKREKNMQVPETSDL